MPDIQVGDLVRDKRPQLVRDVHKAGVRLDNGQYVIFDQLEMVARQPRKPKVGDKLTPRDISRKQLPLGTVLQSLVDDSTRLVLMRDKMYGEAWQEPKSNLSYTSREMLDGEDEDDWDRQIWRIAYLP